MRWEDRHVWSRWSGWHDAGNGQEMKSRHCLDAKCGATQSKWRKKKEKRK